MNVEGIVERQVRASVAGRGGSGRGGGRCFCG